MKDTELIAVIKTDPDRGIAFAIEEYGGLTKTICKTILKGLAQEEIEEAWSDTFVKLWRNIDRFDCARQISLKAYIAAIARNTALDLRRRNLRRNDCQRIDDLADGIIDLSVNIEDEYARLENEKILHQTVREMAEPDRRIFILRYFFFKPVGEIAEELNLKVKQVENILFRRKSALKANLKKRGITNDESL